MVVHAGIRFLDLAALADNGRGFGHPSLAQEFAPSTAADVHYPSRPSSENARHRIGHFHWLSRGYASRPSPNI